ncbi:TetR family transcriptional regulator [Photobacterium makurazakiensis]|uniref:TetR family transcriptional regulator n=1 Tax=Photobacterium makurazakiensis TaxID=2910234 RepID=UPI003D151FB1
MARKSKEEAEQTRLLLLDTAMKVFCEKGLVKTTLASIATEAGLTRGAIYWHFKDKADLFEALWQQQSTTLQDAAKKLEGASGQTLREGVLNIAKILLTEMRDNPKMVMIMQLSLQGFADESLRLRCVEKGQEDKAKVEAAMQQLQQDNILLPHLTPQVAAVIYESMLSGICEQWIMYNFGYQTDEQLDKYIKSLSLALFVR